MKSIIHYLLKFFGIFKAAGLKDEEERKQAVDVITILFYVALAIVILWVLLV